MEFLRKNNSKNHASVGDIDPVTKIKYFNVKSLKAWADREKNVGKKSIMEVEEGKKERHENFTP